MASTTGSAIGASLRRTPLFSIFSEEELQALASRMEPLRIKMGQTLHKAGEELPGLTLIVSGKARTVALDPEGREMTLSLSEAGGIFGEQSLVERVRSPHTARAAEELSALRLSREAFQAFLADKPELRDLIEGPLKHRTVSHFLSQLTSLKPLEPPAVRSLLKLLRRERCPQGAVLFRVGEPADKLYLVQKGRILLTRPEGQEQKLLEIVREGGHLGGALLQEEPHAASAAALEECDLFSLSREDFQKAVSLSPELREDLYRLLAEQAPLPQAPPPIPEPIPVNGPAADLRRRPRKFPWVRQHDERDCGAACLAMVSQHYGAEISLSRLRDLVNVTREGTTMLAIAEGAQKLGFQTQGMLATHHYLDKFPLPAIAHWKGFHFVVLYGIKDEKVLVADPALGLKEMTPKEFDKGWTGRILLLSPTERVFSEEPSQGLWRRWLPLLKPYKALLSEIFLCSLVVNILGLATPVFVQTIVDQVLVHRSVPMLNLLLAGMVLVAVFQILTGALRNYLLVHVALRLDQALISRFFEHALSLPLRFFERHRVGDLSSRLAENEKIRQMMTHTLPSLLLDVLMTVIYLSLMLAYNLRLTLAALSLFPLFGLLTYFYTVVMKRISQEVFLKRTESNAYGIEAFTGIHTVKSMAVETPTLWNFNTQFGRALKASYQGGLAAVASESAAGLLSTLSSVFLLWYGAHQVIEGRLTVGQLMAFNVLFASVFGPFTRLIGAWGEVQGVVVAMERLNDVFDAEPEETPRRRLLAAPELKGHIRFESVFFRYHASDRKGVLNNIQLVVLPGQTVALVGRSGAGKTSLAKLLLRLYIPTRGRIFLDGHDLATLSPAGLRRQMGVVPQETFLFSGTIRENIALGDSEVRFEEVVEAATLAGAHEFVAQLPLGYDTPVGERGMSLSGGQRQRIAIARALLRDPRILILDEATSSLDSESERAIQKNIASMLKGRTTILISHRLSTVKQADAIFVLDQGWLVESGSHQELTGKKGLYYHLVSQQLEE